MQDKIYKYVKANKKNNEKAGSSATFFFYLIGKQFSITIQSTTLAYPF